MPDTAVNRRKGTTAEHAASFGVLAETSYDTDLKRLVAHDGATFGGFPAAMLHVANIFSQPQTISLPAGAPTSAALDLITDGTSRVTFRQSGFGVLHRQEADVSLGGFDLTKRGTTGNALAALSSGSGIAGINFNGWDGTAMSGTAASMRVFTTEAWTNIAHGTQILFLTTATGSTTMVTSATLTSIGFALPAASILNWSTRSAIASPADGILRLTNAALSDFTRLQLGGTTAAFPAIGRLGNILEIFGADGAGPSGLIIYNTKTSATDFERLDIRWTAGVAQIFTEKGSGGGAATELQFGTDNTARLNISPTGVINWGTGLTISQLETDGSIRIDGGVLLSANVTTGVVDIASVFSADRVAGTVGFFGSLASQQNIDFLVNGITAGGTADTLDDFSIDSGTATIGTDLLDQLTVPDKATLDGILDIIRNDAYQLGEKVNQIVTILKAYGLSVP